MFIVRLTYLEAFECKRVAQISGGKHGPAYQRAEGLSTELSFLLCDLE